MNHLKATTVCKLSTNWANPSLGVAFGGVFDTKQASKRESRTGNIFPPY